MKNVAGTRDIENYFVQDNAKTQLTWRSEPTNVQFLCRISSLIMDYMKIAPSGKLPASKHKDALAFLNSEAVPGVGLCKINFTTKSDADYLDWLDMNIRVTMYMFKSLKLKEEAGLC